MAFTRGRKTLQWLFREGKWTSAERTGQLRTLKALAAGRLRPAIVMGEHEFRGEGLPQSRFLTSAADAFAF